MQPSESIHCVNGDKLCKLERCVFEILIDDNLKGYVNSSNLMPLYKNIVHCLTHEIYIFHQHMIKKTLLHCRSIFHLEKLCS